MRPTLPPLLVLAGLVLASCGGQGGAGEPAPRTFQETDFSSVTWSQVGISDVKRLTITLTPEATGGNPGGCEDVSLLTSGAQAYALLLRPDWTYTPAGHAIQGFTFAEDVQRVDATGASLESGVVAVQNQRYYVAHLTPVSGTGWTTQVANLAASDFAELSLNGTLDSTSHPDFSASGATLTFGVVCAQTGAETTEHRLDNLEIRLQPGID